MNEQGVGCAASDADQRAGSVVVRLAVCAELAWWNVLPRLLDPLPVGPLRGPTPRFVGEGVCAVIWNQLSRLPSLKSMSRCTCTDISSPKPIITVIIAEPPCETSGSGTPPTGMTPITIAMLTNT